MHHFFLILLLAGSLEACATTSGYQEFYPPVGELTTLPDVQFLQKGEAPVIYSSDNLQRDHDILLSKGFVLIGQSSFNGSLEGQEQAVLQAQRIGALVVVVSSTYTNTQINTVPLLIPNNTTTYGSGFAYVGSGSASYFGSSTTYGTAVVPVTTQQRRFDQAALYFVKSTKKHKYGLGVVDLTPELRSTHERNTGALIHVVIEDSPAFYANLLPGDILIQIDGVDVRNFEHALALMHSAAPTNGESQLKVLRNSAEKIIKVQLHRN
jgi:hypothetical protein